MYCMKKHYDIVFDGHIEKHYEMITNCISDITSEAFLLPIIHKEVGGKDKSIFCY